MPQFKLFLPLLPILLFLVACDGRARERRAARGPGYVSDPAHLFFRNTRARDYRSREPEAGVTIYEHDELVGSRAGLQPYIIDRWLEDRAELAFHQRPPQQANSGGEDTALQLATPGGEWETLEAPSEISLPRLRQILAGGRELRFWSYGRTATVFADPAARAAAREVVDDYLRLTTD